MTSCIITVTSAIDRDGEIETIETRSRGTYEYSQDRTVLTYIESAEGVSTPVKVSTSGGKVTIRRGDIMTLRLEENVGCFGEYVLPFGALDMEYRAVSIDNRLTEGGGTLSLVYDMTVGGVSSRNTVEIYVSGGEA